MSELPLHRHYLHYSELPYSQRVLYTAALLVLGVGYLFALLNVYFTYAGRSGGNPQMLTSEDLIVAYSGSGKGSRLEGALRGPMSTMLPGDDRNVIMAWAAEGAPHPAYDKSVQAAARQMLHGLPRRQQSASAQPQRLRQSEEGHGEGHRRRHSDVGAGVAHPSVRHDLHLLPHRADVQPRLCAAGVVQMPRRRHAVRRHHDRCRRHGI